MSTGQTSVGRPRNCRRSWHRTRRCHLASNRGVEQPAHTNDTTWYSVIHNQQAITTGTSNQGSGDYITNVIEYDYFEIVSMSKITQKMDVIEYDYDYFSK